MAASTSEFGLRDIGRAMTRHKIKAVCTFLFAIGVAICALILVRKSYHSTGVLLIRLGKENATLDPTATMSAEAVVAVPTSRESELTSLVEILKSRVIVEKVVDALGPDYILEKSATLDAGDETPRFQRWIQSARNAISTAKELLRRVEGRPQLTERQKAVEELVSQYSVTWLKHSDLIQIDCKGPSPEWAQRVVAELINVYQAEHYKLNRPRGLVSFFAEQKDRALRDLKANQATLRDLKTEGNLVAPTEQRQAFATREGRLEDDLLQAQAARTVSETRVESLRKQLAALPAEHVESVTTGIGNEGTDQMRAQLYQLQIRKEEAAAKFTAAHPAMKAIDQQVEASRNAAGNEELTRTHITKGQNRTYQEIEAALLQEETQLAAAQARQNVLTNQLADLRGRIKQFNQQDLLIAGLERDIEVQQNAYRRFAAGYEQAKIDEDRELQQISNIAIAQPATCEPKADYPARATFLGFGALIGVLAGIGVALLAEARDRSIREPEDIERRLEVPVLATIPNFASRYQSTSGERRV